jgi:DNA-directed RNA polymerase subunit N (RpoN/RPB10)
VVKYKTGESNTETIIDVNNIKKTAEGKALDDLGLKRYCCRNVMLSHTELIDII